jgi:hypothetical protein
MVRTIAYSVPAAAPWALLPLLVREQLGPGLGMYGVVLRMMGIGGVTSGMLLPLVRGHVGRGATVIVCTVFSCAGIALLGATRHWLPAAFGMLLFRVGRTSAYATIQAAASSCARPGCGRGRCRSISWRRTGRSPGGRSRGAGSADQIGMADTLLAAALGVGLAIVVRGYSIDLAIARPVGSGRRNRCRSPKRLPPSWCRCCAARAGE